MKQTELTLILSGLHGRQLSRNGDLFRSDQFLNDFLWHTAAIVRVVTRD